MYNYVRSVKFSPPKEAIVITEFTLPDDPKKETGEGFVDVSSLERSSEALEAIIESALETVRKTDFRNSVDSKLIKDLTGALKDAVNIRQNISLLPVTVEQKALERDSKLAVTDKSSEIRIVVDGDALKYGV